MERRGFRRIPAASVSAGILDAANSDGSTRAWGPRTKAQRRAGRWRAPWNGEEVSRPRSGGQTKENVMILALPLAILGAAFLTYVRLATR